MKKEYEKLYKKGEYPEESLRRLIDIIRILRGQCPWDKEQTHETLRTCMLEEAYEVVDAINMADMANLREELGDVMLQVVFHSLMAEEDNNFNITDVINDECDKMIRRHPHIFLEDEIKSVDKVLEKWENVKSKEHGCSSIADRLEGVPKALPSLMRSLKVQSKVSQVGFDWDKAEEALAKVDEELDELKVAIKSDQKTAISEELGDLLFSVVNVARLANIDPETSLNESISKFIKRFAIMEKLSVEGSHSLSDFGFDEMDELWNKAKKIVSRQE